MNVSEVQTRCRDALTGTGAVIIAAAFLAGVYFPGRARHEQAEHQLEVALEAMRNTPRRAAEIEALRRDVHHVEQFVNTSRARCLPVRTSDVVALTSQLGKDAGLTIVRLQPAACVQQKEHSQWPVEVVCEGTTRSWAAFLHALETGPRLTSVHEVTMSASPDRNGMVEGKVRFSIHAVCSDFSDSAKFNASSVPLTADDTLNTRVSDPRGTDR
jgi:Tfp pilus assembly protein PilO